MSEACIRKLKTEWDKAESEKNWKRLGTCLRNLVNVVRSDEGQIKKHTADLSARVLYLEQALDEMDFKSAIQVVKDIRHARSSVRVNSGEFGSAFRIQLSAKDRKAIRKRTRVPKLRTALKRNDQQVDVNGSGVDDFLPWGMGHDPE